MKPRLFFCIYILLTLSINSCYKEKVILNSEPNHILELPLILKINDKYCHFDNETNTLRYSIENMTTGSFEAKIEFQEQSEVYFNNKLLENNTINNLGNIKINENYNITIITNKTTLNLTLQFTTIPVVQIITHDQIIDEPKTIGRIIINYPEITKSTTTSYIGIEHRGGSSQSNFKKSFGFSFLNSLKIDDVALKSIFDLPPNTQWWLDAMYIDQARLRNKASFEIWNTIQGDDNYGINSSFVELYINNEHQGLYCANQLINDELLNLSSIDAVLYKAIEWNGTKFDFYSEEISTSKYWDGWEQKFPDENNRINWEPLSHLRNVVLNYSDDDFVSEITNVININNFIDYYIFLNLILGWDNRGKNTFLARRSKNNPLFIIPWDLDGVLGRNWDSSQTGYTDILTNGLYDRLLLLNPDNFKNKLTNRWFYLRNNELSNANLIEILEFNFSQLNNSDIISLENTIWGIKLSLGEEQLYINEWLINRTGFLDQYYMGL